MGGVRRAGDDGADELENEGEGVRSTSGEKWTRLVVIVLCFDASVVSEYMRDGECDGECFLGREEGRGGPGYIDIGGVHSNDRSSTCEGNI